jgi:hypothetical protein
VQRFILQQNLIRFRKLLTEEAGNNPHRTLLQSLIVSTQRELALFDSTSSGIGLGVWSSSESPRAGINRDGYSVGQFQRGFESSPHLYMVLDPRPGLHIINVNGAYARATMTTRAVVAGERLFHAFPDNPDDPCADGVSNLYASLRTAPETGRPHAMQVQRYDVRHPNGKFVERYWRAVNTAVFDGGGRLIYLLHRVEDVTREALLSSSFARHQTS